MNPSTIKVLNELTRRGRQGVTVDQFHNGFRLAARIMELRELYFIYTSMETVNYGKRARYFLIEKLK